MTPVTPLEKEVINRANILVDPEGSVGSSVGSVDDE